MWNAIEKIVNAVHFVNAADDAKPSPMSQDKKTTKLQHLMTVEKQPTNAFVAAVPMMWELHVRSFMDLAFQSVQAFIWYHRNVPPPFVPQSGHYAVNRVAVTPVVDSLLTRDAPVLKAEEEVG